jgi:hypothetical protein
VTVVANASARAAVSVTPRPLWRLRLRRGVPRHLLHALAVFGLVASARFAIAPPRPVIVRASAGASTQIDRAGEGFAALFARRYLTWDSANPEAHRLALAPYLGPEMEPEAGFQPPQTGSQRVEWTQVVQAQPDVGAGTDAGGGTDARGGAQAGEGGGTGGGRYTVAVQTDASGLVYLSVGVTRAPGGGALALSGYPAFVGPPPTATAPAPAQLSEVRDAALSTVVQRALRNYLTGAQSELAADVLAGAPIPLPAAPLVLESLDALDWEPDGSSLLALVHARDRAGARYALAYRLAVVAAGGRWEISAIEVAQKQ